jgi:mono/diheme cytochrome c family protein
MRVPHTTSLFQIAVALGLAAACNSHIDKNQPAVGGSKYSAIQERIIKPKCLSCHSGVAPADGLDLSSYAGVMSQVVAEEPDKSPFYQSVLTGRMPKSRPAISKTDLELIAQWIKGGAKETDNGLQSMRPTYQWVHKNIFEPRCLVCHNSERPRGHVDFSTYEALIKSTGHDAAPIFPSSIDKSAVYLEVLEQKMPPKPRAITPEEMRVLSDWIVRGAPEFTPGVIIPGKGEPNPPQANYEWLSKNTLRRCGSCHGVPFKVANVDFTTYQTLIDSPGKETRALVPGDLQKSGIYMEILTGHMPPPQKVLSETELTLLKQWIEAGALNN